MDLSKIIANQEMTIKIIEAVTWIATGIFLAIAVSNDGKINHIKRRTLFSVIAFFIPVIVPFYFAFRRLFKTEVPFVCSKCGKKAPKDRKICKHCGNEHFTTFQVENLSETKTKITICLVIGVVIALAGYWAANYSPLADALSENYESYSDVGEQELFDEEGDLDSDTEYDGNDLFD